MAAPAIGANRNSQVMQQAIVPTKERYSDLLFSIIGNPALQGNDSLKQFLRKQYDALARQASSDLSPEQQMSALWAEKLIFEGRVSSYVIGKLTRLSETRISSTVSTSKLSSIAFGAAEWKKYFGDVGVEPPLPANIEQILSAPCPIWPSKKVQETHLLVLVPQTVNGQPLNLKSLGELIQKPLQGNATKYGYIDLGEYTDPAVPRSHWVLMTRDVIDGSRNKRYADQKELVASLSKKTKAPYELPNVLDATVCILMEYVKTGKRLFNDSPWTFTRCQEMYNSKSWPLAVGGFSSGGVHVNYGSDVGSEISGVGVSRMLDETNGSIPTPALELSPPKPLSPPPMLTTAIPKITSISAAAVSTSKLPAIAFGAAEWKKYFGDVGVEPPLPANIEQILSAPCPIWPSKKVQETHLLVLVPQTVNGQPLNLKTLGELIQKPLQGNATKYGYINLGEYTDPAVPRSRWVLMTRDVIEGSRNKRYADQKALVTSLSQKTKVPYELPNVLDATICILMEYVKTGKRLFNDSPWTFTRCQEMYNSKSRPLSVGGFSSGGVRVFYATSATRVSTSALGFRGSSEGHWILNH